MKKIILALALAFSTPVLAQECTTQATITQQAADAGFAVSVELKGQSIRTFVAAVLEVEGTETSDAELDVFVKTIDTIVLYGSNQSTQIALALFKDDCATRVVPMDIEVYQLVMKKVEQKAKAD